MLISVRIALNIFPCAKARRALLRARSASPPPVLRLRVAATRHGAQCRDARKVSLAFAALHSRVAEARLLAGRVTGEAAGSHGHHDTDLEGHVSRAISRVVSLPIN